MARINMPYREYREGADGKPSLYQSTHAPGQGGSSGAAINVLSQYPRGGKMAGKQSQAVSSPTNMLGAHVDRYMGNSYQGWKSHNRWRDNEMERLAAEAANENAAYERAMGPGTRWDQQVREGNLAAVEDANKRNALAEMTAKAAMAPPQLAQAPLSSYGSGQPSGSSGMGPRRHGGFMQGEDDFYSRMLRDLISNPDSFTGTPGFKFALDSGRQAIERSFAAKGMGNSGNVLSELMKYGTGLASQEYGNRVNDLAGLANREPPTWAMRGR